MNLGGLKSTFIKGAREAKTRDEVIAAYDTAERAAIQLIRTTEA